MLAAGSTWHLAVSFDISYGHPLATSPDPADTLTICVPVSLAPGLPLSDDAARQIAEEIARWTTENPVVPGPGRFWAFSLDVYSQLADTHQPLLFIDQLMFRIRDPA